MAAGSCGDRTLQNTPSWVVAAVCAVFVVISVLIEHKLLSFAGNVAIHRVLAAAAAGGDYCSDGKSPLISQTGLHQLHIFIFVLAIFHVLYSVVTMALAQAKMKKWKAWEEETSSLEYHFTNDPARFRLARQTSFVRRHSGISAGIKWIVPLEIGSSQENQITIKNQVKPAVLIFLL